MSSTVAAFNSELVSEVTWIKNSWHEFLTNHEKFQSREGSGYSTEHPVRAHFQERVKYLLKLISEFIQKLGEWWTTDFIPFLFDIFIEVILSVYKKLNKAPPFSFSQIYGFLSLFGLNKILPQTLDRISAALQWKIISTEWMDYSFCLNYYETLPMHSSSKERSASLNLIQTALMMKKEEEKKERFIEDLSTYLDSF